MFTKLVANLQICTPFMNSINPNWYALFTFRKFLYFPDLFKTEFILLLGEYEILNQQVLSKAGWISC